MNGVTEDGSETKAWYVNGKLHREGDLPAVVYLNGTKLWYNNGKKHRENKSAVEYADGDTEWWLEGLRHCETGPALTYNNCDGKHKEWWIHGIRYTKKEFQLFLEKKKLKKSLHKDLDNKLAQSKLKI